MNDTNKTEVRTINKGAATEALLVGCMVAGGFVAGYVMAERHWINVIKSLSRK